MLQFQLFEIQYMDGGILVIISSEEMLYCIEILRICEDVKYSISRILKIEKDPYHQKKQTFFFFFQVMCNTLSRIALSFSAGPARSKIVLARTILERFQLD